MLVVSEVRQTCAIHDYGQRRPAPDESKLATTHQVLKLGFRTRLADLSTVQIKQYQVYKSRRLRLVGPKAACLHSKQVQYSIKNAVRLRM